MATHNSHPSPTLDFPAEETKTNQESQKQETSKENEARKDVYKTKEIEFRGRKKQIILQNDNGPCPLIAICNVLLLRDAMDLYLVEVTQEKLLSLVGNALIESNPRIYDDKRISDAMDSLHSFAKGIDVDIKFTSIYGFEFTSELAIFDLLDIPLCHGWIVDPEDVETAIAIGSKSYNALTTEPVVLKTPSGQSSGERSVGFAVSTTKTLEVPSQHCSNTRSFADSPPASIEHHRIGKGDTEETIALLRALSLSKKEKHSRSEGKSVYGFSDENQMPNFDDQFSSTESGDETDCDVGNKINVGEEVSLTTPITKSSEAETVCDVETENSSKMTDVHVTSSEANLDSTKNDDSISEIPLKSEAVTIVNPDLSGRSQDDDVQSLDSPVYVGKSSSEKKDTNELTPEEGELIRRFLEDNASQLTWSGLFYLENGVKEGVLCIFFRNNHFYTMLKHDNELYTLVTDEGYQMEPDLVWEKLDEVNGDSLFFTGNFDVFKSDSGKSPKWDQQDAISEAAINSLSKEGMDINPDFQIAMELQQQYWAEDTDSEVPIIRSNHMTSSLPEVKAVLRWQNVQSCI